MKMNIFFLLFLFVSELRVQLAQSTQKPCIDITQKPVMCEIKDIEDFYNPKIPTLKPEDIPCECEVLVYSSFVIDIESKITSNAEIIKGLACLRPVIVSVYREDGYDEWGTILKSDGNAKDANVLIEYAKCNDISGYKLIGINPKAFLVNTFIPSIAKNIIPYLKQLKFSNEFLVSIEIEPFGLTIRNPCVNDFALLNVVLDFYTVTTYSMNPCRPKVSNQISPVKLVPHGKCYLLSMEETTEFLGETKCDLEKIYYDVELNPLEGDGDEYMSYTDVCTSSNFSSWCIPNTKDFFEKGQYVNKQHAGMMMKYLNMDDINNVCGCGAFIALKNAIAGFYGKDCIPCKKFDVQQAPV